MKQICGSSGRRRQAGICVPARLRWKPSGVQGRDSGAAKSSAFAEVLESLEQRLAFIYRFRKSDSDATLKLSVLHLNQVFIHY